MSDPQAQMLQEAIGRAQSRAQILHSLQENFKNKKIVPINTTNQPNKKKANNNNNSKNYPNYNKNSNNNNNNHQQQIKNQTLGQGKKRKEDESEAPSSSSAKKARKSTDVASFQEIVDRSIGILLKVAGTSSDRNREYFRENISNKTIVLESTKKVAKAANRMKRQQRRMKKLSARQQRRRGLCETLRRSYGPAETEELLLLAALFEHYLAHLLDSCASSLQLQVRLAGAELVGAELLVVDATPRLRETVGLAGIVIGRTASLVFLFLGHLPGHGRTSQEAAAEEAENQPQRPPRPFSRDWLRRQVVVKLPLREVALALPLPLLAPPPSGRLSETSRREQQRARARYPAALTLPALPTAQPTDIPAQAQAQAQGLSERMRELREFFLSRDPLDDRQQLQLLREEAEAEELDQPQQSETTQQEEEEKELPQEVPGETQEVEEAEEEEEVAESADFLAFGQGGEAESEDESLDEQQEAGEAEGAELELFVSRQEPIVGGSQAVAVPFRSFRRVALLRGQSLPPRHFL